MMLRLLLIIVFFGSSWHVYAQNTGFPQIEFSSHQALESNHVTRSFFSGFYAGNYLDSALKWDAIGQLHDKNAFGYFSNNTLRITFENEKRLRPLVSFSKQNLLAIGFTEELFQLIFTGNSHLTGTPVSMSPGFIQQYSYFSIEAGMDFSVNDRLRVYASGGPAVLNGLTQADFSSSSFFTSSNADSIAFQLSGDYLRSGGFAWSPGQGFLFSAGVKHSGEHFAWEIQLADMGLFFLNKKTISSGRDTLLTFTGLDVLDITDVSSSIDNELNEFEEALTLSGDTASTTWSPPVRIAFASRYQTGRFFLDINVIHYTTKGFVPYSLLNASYNIYKGLWAGIPLKYGGFGSFNAGLSFMAEFGENLEISLLCPLLLKQFGGQSPLSFPVSLGVCYKIKENESSF